MFYLLLSDTYHLGVFVAVVGQVYGRIGGEWKQVPERMALKASQTLLIG